MNLRPILFPYANFQSCFRLLAFVLVACAGCGDADLRNQPGDSPSAEGSTPAAPAFPGVTLKVAALDDPALGQIAADLVGEWRVSRKAEVEILPEIKAEPGKPVDPSVDIWLIRGQRLGELIDAGAIAPIGDLNADWAMRPPIFDEMICRYGTDRYAVPLGTSVLVMAYRDSVINDPATKAEAEKQGLVFPPQTWDEFDKYVRWLGQKTELPLAMPTQSSPADSLLLDIFLARSTAIGKHRDYFSFLLSADSLEPRIATEPFTQALGALVALKPKQAMTPDEARKALREGKSPILLDYAQNAGQWATADEKSKIGVAPLPGSLMVYESDRKAFEKMQAVNRSAYFPLGGGYLAVLAKGRNEKEPAARDLLQYLTDSATAAQWAADRRMAMLPTRDSILASGFVDSRMAPRVESGAWGESILKQLTSTNYVVGLRVPQAGGFLADLEKSVNTAFTGQAPEAALKTAAEEWSSRIKAYGPQRLKWHYRRSLVKPVTDTQPPPAGQ